VGDCRSRNDLFKCGAWSGFSAALVIMAFGCVQSLGFKETPWVSIFASSFFCFFSGILATVITSFLIPFFESIFGYTTSLKLIELANFHHPLLHSLMMKAPGTYHHSVIVGSLAEIAADQVGANGLLARVSAYYHDIGKMNKPLYFIENQSPGNNPHDHLQPSMSAKILFSHVKTGVRMGRDYRLGNRVVDIIEQHHGTTLTSYFFNKAKELEEPSLGKVEEAHFRYPGPKPQTREAGIVMLADACEAATRSITDPTPGKIQAMVHHIITKRFLEEQFSDCELTFKDLQIIEVQFTRILVSLHHHRIEYPGQKSALHSHPESKEGQAHPSKQSHPHSHSHSHSLSHSHSPVKHGEKK
jgi:putative nucleotidyltransferase with HDIG domain